MFLRPILALACAAAMATAQEAGVLAEPPTPFSVWLDLHLLSKPGAAKPALPIWFESFQNEPVAAKDGEPPMTVYRLRLRRMPSLHREILLRVLFDDIAGMQPVVTAWTESGRELFRSATLGVGAGLPTSESLVVPLEGADYVDIDVPGDGSSIRGVLASSLKDVTTRQTLDFQAATEVQDPFGNLARGPALRAGHEALRPREGDRGHRHRPPFAERRKRRPVAIPARRPAAHGGGHL